MTDPVTGSPAQTPLLLQDLHLDPIPLQRSSHNYVVSGDLLDHVCSCVLWLHVLGRGYHGWAAVSRWWRSTCPSSVTWSQHRRSSCAPASRWWSPTLHPVSRAFRRFICWFWIEIRTSLSSIYCRRNKTCCVCLLPERVIIREGDVDISDSDDEDESRFHSSNLTWNVVYLSVSSSNMFWDSGDVCLHVCGTLENICQLFSNSLVQCTQTNSLIWLKTFPETLTSVTWHCSSFPDMFHRKSHITFACFSL